MGITKFNHPYREWKPGPASTEGDRPPTNPAIRVRFPAETDGCFFSPWQINARSIHLNYFSAKIVQRHLLDFLGSGLYTLSLYEKGTYLQIGPMGRSFKRWASNHTTLLRNSTILLLQNYSSNLWHHHYELNHTAESLEMDEEQCHRPSEKWNMRPIG